MLCGSRYSVEFRWYITSLFGQNGKIGLVGAGKFLATMIILASGLLRTKIFQKCLILYGVANNGKSTFIDMITRSVGNLAHNVDPNIFFSNKETCGDTTDLTEKIYVHASECCKNIALDRFKGYMTEDYCIKKRAIYQPILERYFNALYITACNTLPSYIKESYRNKNKENIDYDLGFHRRWFPIEFVNVFEDTSYKYNIKDERVSKIIEKDLLKYMLDIIRIFGLHNLVSNSSHISAPLKYQRDLAQNNNIVIKHLCKAYDIVYSQDLSILQPVSIISVLSYLKLKTSGIEELSGLLVTFGYKVSDVQNTPEGSNFNIFNITPTGNIYLFIFVYIYIYI